MANAERESLGLPLTRFDSIATALRTEIVSRTRVARPTSARLTARWPLQVAAGLLLVAGGAVLGRATAGARVLPGPAVPSNGASTSAIASTRLTSDSGFSSVEEAREAQQRYELLFQQATAFLAQHDSTGTGAGSPIAYRSRLAALDRVISTTREAMRDAPHDPVINGYYLTTLGQREATLRQLNTALPASLRLDSF